MTGLITVGVLGATDIAVRAIVEPARNRPDVHVRAVAARDRSRAHEWAQRHGVPVVHSDYRALVDDDAIDLVYIALHPSAHAEWAAEAALHGKHVLVEKPLCLNARELHAIRVAACLGDVSVQEAVMTGGHPWQEIVADAVFGRGDDENGRRLLSDLGALTGVHTEIGFAAPDSGFRARPELGGGVLLDAGPYWLQALQATCGLEVRSIRAHASFTGSRGADRSANVTLGLASGADGTLDAKAGTRPQARHRFQFEHGRVTVARFMLPAVGELPVNLMVERPQGSRVVSLPASDYYIGQLERTLATVTKHGGARTAPAVEQWRTTAQRVLLLDRIHRSALADAGVDELA